MIWTLRDILDYLDKHGITFTVHRGKPSLSPPYNQNPAVLTRVASHVKARRAEIIAHFNALGSEAKLLPDVGPPQTRADAIKAFELRAVASGKRMWVLRPDGLAIPVDTKKGRKEDRAGMEEAKWVCIEGDAQWTQIPAALKRSKPV